MCAPFFRMGKKALSGVSLSSYKCLNILGNIEMMPTEPKAQLFIKELTFAVKENASLF